MTALGIALCFLSGCGSGSKTYSFGATNQCLRVKGFKITDVLNAGPPNPVAFFHAWKRGRFTVIRIGESHEEAKKAAEALRCLKPGSTTIVRENAVVFFGPTHRLPPAQLALVESCLRTN